MPDSDEPTGSGADDVWARLRRLEDLERRPAPSERRAAPPPDRAVVGRIDGGGPVDPDPDATSVMPRPDATAVQDAVPGGAPRQFHVAAPGAAPIGGAAAAPSAPRTAPRRTAPPDVGRQEYQRAAAAAGPSADRGGANPSAATTSRVAGRARGRDGGGGGSRFRPKLRWFRPKLRWFFLYLPLLVILLIGGVVMWGWSTFNDLYRVDLGDALTPATGTAVNYLIVGSDSREGIESDTPNVGVIGTGTQVAGRRSDTIILLRVDGDRATMMSIPRDLWVTNAATGDQGRINGTYAQGPDNLARSVTANLGIPINRYVEVDFVSFAGMVDAMGGIPIEFPHPVIDPNSGLKIPTAGVHQLDGSMALAYVRSRHYTEEIDGRPVLEPTADLGRQQRQQNFIRTVLREVGATRNPITLARVGGAAAKGVRVDTEVGFVDLVDLARQLSGSDPETVVLPTRGANKGGASVLELVDAEALPILAEFGAG